MLVHSLYVSLLCVRTLPVRMIAVSARSLYHCNVSACSIPLSLVCVSTLRVTCQKAPCIITCVSKLPVSLLCVSTLPVLLLCVSTLPVSSLCVSIIDRTCPFRQPELVGTSGKIALRSRMSTTMPSVIFRSDRLEANRAGFAVT